MEKILAGIPRVRVMLDDIIVTGDTFDDHLKNVRTVLDRLLSAGLRTQKAKCKWFQEEVLYLGHRISKEGIQPTAQHLKAIQDMPAPTSI
ncbi:unnamed protein product, partial [Nesidiocoris tenuis]